MKKSYSVAIAGSTAHTRLCAETLFADSTFVVTHVLTPAPRPVGRKQLLTPNPLDQWATENEIPTTLVHTKIDAQVQAELLTAPRPDFLLVVDFGYLIPSWLLAWPTQAALNIHPSLLPRWRGSSPGQFVLLHYEKNSAVSLMVMDEQLDHGPLIAQLPFSVELTWTQTEYYGAAFSTMSHQLSQLITQFAEKKLLATPQPDQSPTPVARRLTREDGFVSWDVLQYALQPQPMDPDFLSTDASSSLLKTLITEHHSVAKAVFHATFALQPWPSLWTVIPTSKGNKRMKIITVSQVENSLVLQKVQIEGKNPATWNEVQTLVRLGS